MFKEYRLQNEVKPVYFLIRRGFKIYPVYYFFLLVVVLIRLFSDENLRDPRLLYDVLFISNYLGSLWAHTWSLCVEEHFYFLLSAIVFVVIKKNKLADTRFMNRVFLVIALLCLASRLTSYLVVQKYGTSILFNQWAVYAQTHNRIDSLVAGVTIAYNLNFQPERFRFFFEKIRAYVPYVIGLLLLPFILKVSDKILVNSFLYISNYLLFALLLLLVLFPRNPGKKSPHVVTTIKRIIGFVGINSYAIYLFDPIVTYHIMKPINSNNLFLQAAFSITIGFLVTLLLEKRFLKIRDKYFPPRDRQSGQGGLIPRIQ